MITGTNAYCKLTKITVTENLATFTLLIFATQSTVPAKAFRLCVKDTDTGHVSYIDNNTYWIDKTHNYDFDSNNVDTNKYKEIMFTLDISRNNTSQIKDNKWIRKCYIYLLDSSKTFDDTPAWSSDLLDLISDKFEMPEISNIFFESVPDVDENSFKIKCDFDLVFKSQKDFNYNNSNINAFLRIRSYSSDKVIEEKEIISSTSIHNSIITENSYEQGIKYTIQIVITNKNGETILEKRRTYVPNKKITTSFIKCNDGIKKIMFIHVQDDDNNSINYNNITITKPNKIYPEFFIERSERTNPNGTLDQIIKIKISDKLKEQMYMFYENYIFEVYMNDRLVKNISKENKIVYKEQEDGSFETEEKILNEIELINIEEFKKKFIQIQIKGYYYSNTNKTYFETNKVKLSVRPTCGTNLKCGDNIKPVNLIDGYYYNGKFYLTKETVDNEINYKNEIEGKEKTLYCDIPTELLYRWTINENLEGEFVLI